MNELERRYRRALRWYPASWRAEHSDEVTGVLLELAESENRSRPQLAELASLVLNGLRLRLAIPVAVRDGAATVALAFGTAISAVFLVFDQWAPWVPVTHRLPLAFGPFSSPGAIVYALWILALLLAVVGLRRSSRFTLVLALLGSLTLALPFWVGLWPLRPSSVTLLLLAMLAGLALLGHAGASGRARASLGVATLVSLGLLTALAGTGLDDGFLISDRYLLWGFRPNSDWPALLSAIALTSALVLAKTAHRTSAGIIAVSALPWLCAWCALALRENPEVSLIALASLCCIVVLALLSSLVAASFGYRITVQKRTGDPARS